MKTYRQQVEDNAVIGMRVYRQRGPMWVKAILTLVLPFAAIWWAIRPLFYKET